MTAYESWRPHPSPASNEVQEHRGGAWLPVAHVFAYDPEDVQARRRLIAAAPDLLRACEAAVRFSNGEPLVDEHAFDLCEAAVRYARGES